MTTHFFLAQICNHCLTTCCLCVLLIGNMNFSLEYALEYTSLDVMVIDVVVANRPFASVPHSMK